MSGAITAAATIGAAALGAGASMSSASKSSNAARRASEAQQRLQQADANFRQQQYQRYLGLYGATEEKLAVESRSDQPLDYAQNAAAIKQNYSDALRNINTSSGLRGIAGSGLDRGAMRGAAFGQASGLTGAYAQGLQNRRNLGLTLTNKNMIPNAAGNVMGGYQNMAGFYGQQAGMYNQAAAQGWQNAGQGLGDLGYALQNMNWPQKAKAKTYWQPDQLNPIQPRDTSQSPDSAPQIPPL